MLTSNYQLPETFCVVLFKIPENIVTSAPNGPVLFCSLASVGVCRLSSSVTLPPGARTGGPAAGRAGGRHSTAAQSCYVQLGRHLVCFLILHSDCEKYLTVNHFNNSIV